MLVYRLFHRISSRSFALVSLFHFDSVLRLSMYGCVCVCAKYFIRIDMTRRMPKSKHVFSCRCRWLVSDRRTSIHDSKIPTTNAFIVFVSVRFGCRSVVFFACLLENNAIHCKCDSKTWIGSKDKNEFSFCFCFRWLLLLLLSATFALVPLLLMVLPVKLLLLPFNR